MASLADALAYQAKRSQYVDDMTAQPSDLEKAVQDQFGMQPNMDRGALLPYKSKDKGWVAPEVAYQLAKLLASPSVAMHGGNISPQEAIESGNTLSGFMTPAGLLSKPSPAMARMFMGEKSAKLAEQLENFAPHETAQFKAWSNNNPLITSEMANTYQFKTGEPVALEAFHGAKRPDRIGDTFLAKRATSGPMAFHTSDPELASGYALGKRDTSISYDDLNYDNWFKIPVEGRRNPVNLNEAWHSFTPEQKQTISQLAPRVGFSDNGEHIILHPEGHASGIGNYDWEIKQTKTAYNRQGNPLKALTESWLQSGGLYDDEGRFMEVLKKAGVPTDKVIFNNPHAEMPAVYKNYIKMDKPLVTSDIPPDVVDALNEAAKKDRSKQKLQIGADPWDKRTRTLRDWVDAFNTAKPEDRAYVWTSIPDKVTDVFRSKGYDGIIDYSGKSGLGAPKPVYIPFGEYQLKSAIGNKGKFDPAKKSLILGLAAPVAGGALLMGNKEQDNGAQ